MRRPLAAFALASLLPVTAMGEDDAGSRTFYEVELVIFEHVREDRNKTQERWDPAIIAPRFGDVARYEGGTGKGIDGRAVIARTAGASGDGPLAEFRALQAEDGSLGQAVAKLTDAEGYEVLRHLRWRQPATSPREARPLRVSAGERLSLSVPERGYRQPQALGVVDEAVAPVADAEGSDDQAAAAATLSDEEDDPANRAAPEGDQQADDAPDSGISTGTPFGSGMFAAKRRDVTVQALDGTVTLVVSRYLHLHADLHYTKPVDWRAEVGATRSAPRRIDNVDSGDKGEGESVERRRVAMARDDEGRAVLSYPFEQRRRMRSGELHYLDHPVLGVLVIVQPREMTPSELDDDGA